MSNKGSNFFRQLNSRTNSKLLYNNSLKIKEKSQKNQIFRPKDIFVVEIENNDDLVIWGKRKQFIPKEKTIVKTNGKIITIIKDGIVKNVKTSKEEILALEEKIKNEVPFEQKIHDINERKIKFQLNKIIKEDKEKLTKLNEELEKIKDNAHEYKLCEEVKDLDKKIKKIKETLKDIKEHYEIISEYYDFKGYKTLKNEILLNSIEDYYFYQDESQIEEFVRKCKTEGKRLSNIVETYEKCLRTEEKILEIKDYTQKRDDDYSEHNAKVELVEKGYTKIIENFTIEDEFIKNLNTDLYFLEQKIENKRVFSKSKSLFNNLFNIGLCMTLMPVLPNFKMLIQLILFKNSVEATHKFLNPEIEKTFTNTIVREYLHLIFDKEKLVLETEKMLDSTLKSVKDLRQEYIKKFSKYRGLYKEYELYLTKLEHMEAELSKKQKQILKAKYELEKNKEKVKTLKKD